MSAVLKLKIGRTERLLRGQDHFWSVMREKSRYGVPFSVGDVLALSDEDHRSSIADYFRKLEKAGHIERTGERTIQFLNRPEPLFRISRNQTAAPKLTRDGKAGSQGRSQQFMWNVMRRSAGGWTASELAISASTDDVHVTRNTALAYCVRLSSVGMLVVVDKGKPGHERRWRLKGLANTGPKPPMILRSKMVYDQNTELVVGDVLAEEDRP